MTHGVLVNGKFEEREIYQFTPREFVSPVWCRRGTYDEYVAKEIQRSYGLLRVKDKIVLDIGANIGAFSLWALDGGARQVIAMEPEKNNAAMLDLNLTEFESRSLIWNSALTEDTDGEGELWLSTTGKNPGNSSTTPRRGRMSVPIDLASVATLKKTVPVVDVAKIDCEGAEYEFMEELIDAYPSLKQVAMEIHLSGFGLAQARNLDTFMLNRGFSHERAPRIQDGLWQTLATYTR